MFERLGREAGYGYRRTWTAALPTDGLWVMDESLSLGTCLPITALEVAVTESPKVIKGSLDTLAEVSPALGILCIHEVEIRRGLIRCGLPAERITARVARCMAMAKDRILRMQQRVIIWSYAEMETRYRFNTGDRAPTLLTRLTT